MTSRKIKIVATGKYLPQKRVSSLEMDKNLDKVNGWTFSRSGITERFYAANTEAFESSTAMAVNAIHDALKQSKLDITDIDCIIAASGVPQQAIPCSAAIIRSALGMDKTSVATFDVNATCLSFLVAMDMISYAIDAGRFKNVVIVSSDISSTGLDFQNQPDVAIMFGDGACAAILSKSDDSSYIIASELMTIPEGIGYCSLKAGGSLKGKYSPVQANDNDYYFQMDGPKTYRLVAKYVNDFIDNTLSKARLTLDDISLVVPHQASHLGIKHFQKVMKIPDHNLMNILANHGNQMAASMPTAFHEAVTQERIKRGDKILLCGSGAGITMGAMVLVY